MANTSDVLSNLKELRALDQSLWKAFRDAEKKANIGFWNVFKLVPISWKAKGLKWKIRAYPYMVIGAVLASLVAACFRSLVVWTWAIPLYLGCIAWAMKTYHLFIASHASPLINQNQWLNFAFGIDNPSLLLFHTLKDHRAKNGSRIDRDKLESLIKINKANQDFVNTQYGFYDHLRKLLIGTLIAAPATIIVTSYRYRTEIPKIVQEAGDLFRGHDSSIAPFLVLLTLMIIGVLATGYSLLFEGQQIERRRKRYVLLLQILHETWE